MDKFCCVVLRIFLRSLTHFSSIVSIFHSIHFCLNYLEQFLFQATTCYVTHIKTKTKTDAFLFSTYSRPVVLSCGWFSFSRDVWKCLETLNRHTGKSAGSISGGSSGVLLLNSVQAAPMPPPPTSELSRPDLTGTQTGKP